MSIIQRIKSIFLQKEQSVEEQLNINFGEEGEGWERAYSINGQLVSEFNYLFTYVLSKQNIIEKEARIQNKENIKLYASNYKILVGIIDDELDKPILKEEEASNISHELAIRNLTELKNILTTMKKYQTIIEQYKKN